MKFRSFISIAIIIFSSVALNFAQRPRGEKPPFGDGNRPPRPEWLEQIDVNKNGRIEHSEYKSAAETFFKFWDKNDNGVLEQSELPPKPTNGNRLPPQIIPPFIFLNREDSDFSRNDFNDTINQRFTEIDRNGDDSIDQRELGEVRPQRRREDDKKPSPTAQFLGMEMRFGDKLVKDSPFSAEIIIENTRRLFDGSTATKQNKGAIYRDTLGRTRREQTLEDIGGVSIGESQKLVFINDFVGKTHYFIDVNRKVVRRNPLPPNPQTQNEFEPRGGKTESLGTKMLEGVKVEGTRTTVEIPAGQIGNDKPLQAVTEKWFSPDLQMIIYSRHIDPLSGEQIFRLVNIKLGEPSAELFIAPKDFRIEK